jgi:hypothetical protein
MLGPITYPARAHMAVLDWSMSGTTQTRTRKPAGEGIPAGFPAARPAGPGGDVYRRRRSDYRLRVEDPEEAPPDEEGIWAEEGLRSFSRAPPLLPLPIVELLEPVPVEPPMPALPDAPPEVPVPAAPPPDEAPAPLAPPPPPPLPPPPWAWAALPMPNRTSATTVASLSVRGIRVSVGYGQATTQPTAQAPCCHTLADGNAVRARSNLLSA